MDQQNMINPQPIANPQVGTNIQGILSPQTAPTQPLQGGVNRQAYNPYITGNPVAVPTMQPVINQPAPQPAPQQPAPQPTPQPVPQQPVTQPVQPVAQPTPQPAPQPAPQPLFQPAPAPQITPQAAPQVAPQTTQPVSPISNAPTQQPAKPAVTSNKTAEAPLSTQATLLISELRDGLVVMKDGSFRAVVACQSINFDLMSEAEREAVEFSYQNFLNSLNFTTQILIRSQRVDIGPYIERLTNIRRNTDNMLLGVLMDDYINFIDILSQEANIMDKSFFIVIPYYTSSDAEKVLTQTKNIFSSFSKPKQTEVTKIDRATYDKAVTELNNRVESVISGLFQIGIHSVRLNTRELGALYYNFNNPDTAVREPLVDFSNLATTYVKKGAPNATQE